MPVTLRTIIDAGLQQVDFLLQSRFCLAQPLFVDDPAAAMGAAVYTAEDWGRVRRLQTEPLGSDLDRYGSDEAYRRYLSLVHESKILSVQSLMRGFDFAAYTRVLELGCGDMPQAFTVCSRYPDISYTASDFDPDVIERCGRLPLLSGIRKLVLDVARDDLDVLREHDLIISWSLEFALNDEQLMNLFAACRKYTVPYLLCTHTAIGPISYLRRSYRMKKLARQVPQDRMRMLGWLRSAGEISRLAKEAGMELKSTACHVNHAVLFLTPT